MAVESNQSAQNSGQGAGTVGQGVGRDVNASFGFGDIKPDLTGMLSNLGASTSSATSGAVTVGDRIIGGTKSSRQFGLVKILAIGATVAILLKLYKKMKG